MISPHKRCQFLLFSCCFSEKFSEIFYGYKDEIIIGYKKGTEIIINPGPTEIYNENDEILAFVVAFLKTAKLRKS